jgi:hypothetical protein
VGRGSWASAPRRSPGGRPPEVDLDRAGDFSTYWLALGWVLQPDGRWDHVIAALDRRSIALVNSRLVARLSSTAARW